MLGHQKGTDFAPGTFGSQECSQGPYTGWLSDAGNIGMEKKCGAVCPSSVGTWQQPTHGSQKDLRPRVSKRQAD